MLKKRVGAVLILKDGLVVQSTRFQKYLPTGKPAIAIEFLNQWGIDEIIMLDISATRSGRSIDPQLISDSVAKCFVPLAVGGGITSLDTVASLLQSGADKVVLNNILFKNEKVLTDISVKYGRQFVIACIDVKRSPAGDYRVFDYLNNVLTDIPADTWAKKLETLGAGEILIHDVDRDGTYTGFDSGLCNLICDQVSIPVIIAGGAGGPDHFVDVFSSTTVSAAAAGNFFHFSEHSVIKTKAALQKKNIDVRLETHADYRDATIDNNNRLHKKPDDMLDTLLYVKIEKEII